jgi:DNA helicase-2/ATP-dependent DNA helicase PcrA
MTPLLWAAADVLFANADHRAYLADDDQTIYSYQGADPRLFNDRPATNVRLLEQSYRLPSRIVDLAARVIGQNSNRVEKTVLPRLDGEREGAAERVRDLSELLLDNGESWMLLVRNWAFVSDLAAELERDGIPYRVQGDAYYCPWSDRGPLKAARLIYKLSTPGTAVELRELEPFLDKTRVASKDRPAAAWRFGAKTKIKELIEAEPAGRVSLLDLPRLGLTEWGFDRIATRNLEVLAQDVSARDLACYQAAIRKGSWECVLTGEPIQTTLSTIHGVKGGEADNVGVLMACTQAPARNMEREDRREREEEIRLQYVGITRAAKRFYGIEGDWLSFGQPWDIEAL